ncbi:MAG TPA: protein kinase [Polyangiaceae bacterium]|jgi:serine/threonine-protein kinase
MPITLAANLVIAERFRLNHQLGRGGMGSVWHATHLGLDIPCAVKFIEGSHATLPEAHARFEREAKAAALLRSPHVVQVLDHGVFEGTPYIAMELLEGEDLGKRLQRVRRLAPAELLKVVAQVCRALTKAHSVGIVHRDLKPDNIFIVKDDDREIAKVLDFGIAKATGSHAIEGSNTKTGAMLGTPYYMSPEQAQGTKAVDHRSDLWALAVIVYSALTGRLPFESEALGDLLVQIIVAPIPIPSQVAADLPPGFDAWWAKASQRDPSMRFSSARELSEALTLALGVSGSGLSDAQPTRAGDSFPPPPNGRPVFAQTPPAGGTLAITPSPALRMGSNPLGGSTPAPTTGAPMSRTFAGTPSSGSRPSTGTFVALGGGALLVVVLSIVGISFAMRGKSGSAAAGEETTGRPMVAATTTAPPAVTLEPPPPVTAAVTAQPAEAAPPSSASAATPGPVATATVKPPTIPVFTGPATKPPPAVSAKKKQVDLGI